MRKILQISILCLVSLQFASAQSMKAYVEAAEAAFADKDFYSSLTYYAEALKQDKSNVDIMFNIAESARMFDAYSLADSVYTRLIESDAEAKYPMATYWLAEMMQKQGKYDEASVLYNSYITEFSEEGSYFSLKADKEMASCNWSKEINENPDGSVTIDRLGAEVNTPYSEFSGVMIGKDLNYASMQFEKLEDTNKPHRKISKIMKSVDGGLGVEIDGDLNDDIHSTGNISYSSDGNYMYYTVCEYKNASEIRCDLFYRSLNNGNLGEAVKLPEFINSLEHTSTQPAVVHDKFNDKDMLFFVSDRTGGKGKLDIWYTMINDNLEFSEPVNVSEINTVENEITPFCLESTSELFFSSDGYQGLGGYDVYSVVKLKNSFSKPAHMSPPTNSSYNDIYYSLNEDGTVGHMSSNRKGSLYLDDANEGCCYDIYKLDIEPVIIDLLALTFDMDSGGELIGTTVKLYDAETNELLETVISELNYEHKFKLEKNRCYYIVAKKLTYKPERAEFCTNNITSTEKITKKLYLSRDQIKLDVFVYDKESMLGIEGCTFMLTDQADRTSSVSIDNPKGNDFHFDLKPGRKYTLVGTHGLYGKKTITIDANDADDSGRIIKKLYFERGLNLFLPLVLYFDNDRPGVKSKSTTINKSYSETYGPFIAKKSEFMTKGSNSQAIGQFFDIDVMGGYRKMNLFLEGLTRALGSGEQLNVVVKGFASPRAATDYNLNLGQRRVHSLRNEINSFGGGVLGRYIKSGQLIITDVSLGENTAPSGISDQYKNEKLSVYSVEASRERRVEILRVKKIK